MIQTNPRVGCCLLALAWLSTSPQVQAQHLTNNIDFGFTTSTGSCTRTIFTPGSSAGRVEVRAVPTQIAAWGTGMDFATGIRSSHSAIRARITERRGGPTNHGNRCPATGSIAIELSPGANFSQVTDATITVEFALGRTWTFPVRMHPNSINALEWSVDDVLRPLERCMRSHNGDFSNPTQRLIRNKRINITVPRNFHIESPDCRTLRSTGIDVSLVGLSLTALRHGGFAGAWRYEATGPVLDTSSRHLQTRFGCTDPHRPDACGTLLLRPDWNRIAALPHPSQATVNVQVFYADKPMGNVTIGIGTSPAVSTVPRTAPTPGAPAPGTTTPQRPPLLGGEMPPNLLPQRVSTTPLLRVVGGLQGNRMVPALFCAGLAQDEIRTVAVPALVWGVSVANEDVNQPVTTELRSGNEVLSRFDTAPPLRQNAAPQTRTNYPGRPAQVRVARVVGPSLRQQYANQTGCFIDNTLPANSPLAQVDRPDLSIVVDPQDNITEGDAGERDNTLPID